MTILRNLINKLKSVFDYVYYLSSRKFYKRNSQSEESPASLVVSMLICLLTLILPKEILLLLNIDSSVVEYKSVVYTLFLFIFLGVIIITRIKYLGSYEKFHKRWGHISDRNLRWHGFLIVLGFIFLILFMITRTNTLAH